MENKILLDENKKYKFDFSKSKYVLNIHELAAKTTMLSDVDFITATEKEIIFIEYKNANIDNAKNPDAMLHKTKSETFYKKITRTIINDFDVCNLEEWSDEFPCFSITPNSIG